MDFTFMDPATAKLAIEFCLSDINNILMGLENNGPTSDNERETLEIVKKDLSQQLVILEGQVLALGILKEEHEGQVAFMKLLEEEKQAAADRNLALRLAGMDTTHPQVRECRGYQESLRDNEESGTNEQWETAKQLYSDALEKETALPNVGSSSENCLSFVQGKLISSELHTKEKHRDAILICCVCFQDVPEKNTLTLRCKPEPHTYCRTCLIELFKIAVTDDALFPPRCCKEPIPVETCRALLPRELVKDFGLKLEELTTPNPTHCFKCNKFIRPREIISDVGTCVFCRRKTCTTCKSASHEGLCPVDPHVKLLMDSAKRSKWQQCERCKNMVELTFGCFHMR
jgi:hypothetical protein